MGSAGPAGFQWDEVTLDTSLHVLSLSLSFPLPAHSLTHPLTYSLGFQRTNSPQAVGSAGPSLHILSLPLSFPLPAHSLTPSLTHQLTYSLGRQLTHSPQAVGSAGPAGFQWDEVTLEAQLRRVALNPRLQRAQSFYDFLSLPDVRI